MDVNVELKFLGKLKKNLEWGGGGRGSRGGWEQIIEVFVKIKKKIFFLGGLGRVGGGGEGGQGGCERRIEVFVKIQKKWGGGGSGGGD